MQGGGSKSRTTPEHPEPEGGAKPPPPPRPSIQDLSAKSLENQLTFYKGDRAMLLETYIPPALPHREEELQQILDSLMPLAVGHTAENIMIYGKSGTGKTAVARTAADQVVAVGTEKGQQISRAYVNCAVASTPYAFLRELANDLRPEGTETIGQKLGTHAVYQKIRGFCQQRGGSIIIIIDEVDRVKGRNEETGREFLYSISNINSDLKGARVTLVLITNALDFAEKLDTRIKSRLSASRYLFAPYNRQQLEDILRQRVEMVFAPHAVDDEVIAVCAVLAAKEHGDARKAVTLLRAAAQAAQNEGAKKVTANHVMAARSLVEMDTVSAGVRDLPEHDKIIMLSVIAPRVGRTGPPTMGEAYNTYCQIAEKVGYIPIALRNFRNHVWDLENQALVKLQLQNTGRRGGRNHLLSTDVQGVDIARLIEGHETLGPIAKSVHRALSGGQTRLE